MRILLILLGICFLLAVAIFKPMSKNSYEENPKYITQLQQIDSLKIKPHEAKYFKSGWAKVNITPNFPISIASYRIRKAYQNVHDSLYIKTFVFDDGVNRSYLVIADLLIFPPEVLKKLKSKLGEELVDKIYFSATHTHNAPGGWLNAPIARFITGPYNDEYTSFIADAVIRSMEAAEAKMQFTEISYGETEAGDYVSNRVNSEGKKETKIRYLIFKNKNGLKAMLFSFSAHANCLSSKEDSFSGDYPAVVSDSIEKNNFEMAAYAAGAVGSMANECKGTSNFHCMKYVGSNIAGKILESLPSVVPIEQHALYSGHKQLMLEGPSPMISSRWAIRPWLFNSLIGEPKPFISYLKIGNILFLGMPCDFSGEIADTFYNSLESRNLKLLITSFNGDYIGYITPDSYKSISHHETREMNWYGLSGSYFEKIIARLIETLD